MDRHQNGQVALLVGQWSETLEEAARLMAGQGMRLLLIGPDYAVLDRAAWRISGAGGEVHVIVSDVESWGARATESFAQATCYDRVDVLCLSPYGRSDVDTVFTAPPSRLSDVVPDMHSIVLPLLGCLSQMIHQDYGRIIVNISDEEQWGLPSQDVRASMLEDLIRSFIGLLAEALTGYDVTANVLMAATAACDAEAKAQAILHLATRARGDLTGHLVKVVNVGTPASRVSSVDRQLLKALIQQAMQELKHRVN